jgi:hypothetical protein
LGVILPDGAAGEDYRKEGNSDSDSDSEGDRRSNDYSGESEPLF